MKKVLFILFILLCATAANAQSTNAFTLQFNHDGVDTDGYVAVVDGARVPVTPTCSGSGTTRLCTSPLSMTIGVPHTVTVIAFNVFGEAVSDPFVAKPPSKPLGVKAGK